MPIVAYMLDMKEELIKKAFDFASVTIKQLITLSTALLAFSITFKGNFDHCGSEIILLICWIFFFFSVLSGIWTLMALTGTLEKSTEEVEKPVKLSIYGSNVKYPYLAQILFFIIGLLFLGNYGWQSSNNISEKATFTDEIKIIRETTYKFVEPTKKDTVQVKENDQQFKVNRIK